MTQAPLSPLPQRARLLAIAALALLPIASPAQSVAQEIHGTSDAFAGQGVAVVWGVLRGAKGDAATVVLRVAAASGTRLAAAGVDPFTKERRVAAAEQTLATFADIRIDRQFFADFPRTELSFSASGTQPARLVYYFGVPDTAPEFDSSDKLEAHLSARLGQLIAR